MSQRAGWRVLLGRALVAGLVIPIAACGGDEGDSTLHVLAAASLTDVFTELAADFEQEHPGVEVELSFASSTSLAEQAADGAPGDVLATADTTAMDIAVDAGVATDPVAFATNRLVIVTPAGNPADVLSLADLDGTAWVRCADAVPCGRIAFILLEAAAVDTAPSSLEEDVRAVLEKVTAGEADAGLVYASDAHAAGDTVTTVAIPTAADTTNTSLVAPLAQTTDADLADAFVDLVTGPAGQRVLDDAGFGSVDTP